MAKQTSYSGMLGDLARLSDALTANAAEIPHLEGIRARLEKTVNEAQEVAKEQAALMASKQEASKRLKVLLAEGNRMATGVRRFITENYGLRAEKLTEFGIQPFRGRKTRNAVPEPETPSPGLHPAGDDHLGS
jgi:chromosome segregation ATPase